MKLPDDFERVADLLGEACEAAATPSAESGSPSRASRTPGARGKVAKPQGGAGDPARALAMAWSEVAGAEVAANAVPVRLREGRLLVSTSSSVWAHTLQYMSADLATRLNQRLGSDVISDISFRHAGWEQRPVRDNAPPPPREGTPSAGLTREQEQALAEIEALDLPPAVKEKIAAAMRASFVRDQQHPVR